MKYGIYISFSTYIGKLNLAPDRNSFFFHSQNNRQISRHPRTHYNQIKTFHLLFRKSSENNADFASLTQLCFHCLGIFFIISIIQNYLCPFFFQ